MSPSILLVDDEKDFVDTLSERLKLRGYTVKVAYDGPGGLAIAQKDKPDIAVVDWLMPGMSGQEVLQILRAQYPGLPALFLTGNSVDSAPAQPDETCVCLTKPVSLNILLEQIRLALEGGPSE